MVCLQKDSSKELLLLQLVQCKSWCFHQSLFLVLPIAGVYKSSIMLPVFHLQIIQKGMSLNLIEKVKKDKFQKIN